LVIEAESRLGKHFSTLARQDCSMGEKAAETWTAQTDFQADRPYSDKLPATPVAENSRNEAVFHNIPRPGDFFPIRFGIGPYPVIRHRFEAQV